MAPYLFALLSVLCSSMLTPALAGNRLYVVDAAGRSIEVSISESIGQEMVVRAECVLPTDVATVWGVLSNYEELDAIVPAVTESRIVRHEGGGQVLYQRGRTGLWILRRGFQVWFQVEEEPMSRIAFRSIEGDFRRFEGSWEISAQQAGTRISHQVEIEPRFYAPRWAIRKIGVRLMQETVKAVVERCLSEDPHLSKP